LRWRARRRVQVRNPFPTPEANLDKSIALPEHGENFGDDNQNRENNDCRWQGKRKPQREREALTDWTEQPSESREGEGGGGASFHSGGGCAGRARFVKAKGRSCIFVCGGDEASKIRSIRRPASLAFDP
jgi:hypothetical protein